MFDIGIGEVGQFFAVMLLIIMAGILFSSFLDLFFVPRDDEVRRIRRDARKAKKSKR